MAESLMHCPTCHEAWAAPDSATAETTCPKCRTAAAGETPDGAAAGEPGLESPQSAEDWLVRQILYGLSLPERVVRGAVGLGAGATRELAEVLVPAAFKDSASYRLAIESSLGFLTETVGGIPRSQAGAAPEASVGGEQVARRAVGNFIDLAGMASLHVSPMWVLAVVSDVAYGAGSFMQELACELQTQGVIDDAATIHHVDDLLAAVQRTCSQAAGAVEQPPLSIDELRKSVEETRRSLAEADLRRLLPETEVRRYWEEMRTVASQEHVSLLGVSGAITMQTLAKVKTVGQSALVGVQVAGGLLNRNVLTHYQDSLQRIRQRGLFASVQESCGPYVSAVWNNFSADKCSWTESLLNAMRPSNVAARFSSLFARDEP